MTRYDAPFEIHLHGEVPVRDEVKPSDLEESLRALWQYAGVKSMREGAASLHQEEPGICSMPSVVFCNCVGRFRAMKTFGKPWTKCAWA